MYKLWPLVRVQLMMQFPVNKILYEPDARKKRNSYLMLGVLVFLVCVFAFYAFMISYALGVLGLGNLIPAYGVTLSSLLTFFVTIFKANGIMFAQNDYDTVMSLPASVNDVIFSRFVTLYVVNTVYTAVIMIPMGITYCLFVHPSVVQMIVYLILLLFITLLPTTLAAICGALIIAVASRFRFSNLIAIIGSFLLLILIFAGSFLLSGSGAGKEKISNAVLADLGSYISAQLFRIYPPARWFTLGVDRLQPVYLLLFLGVSVAVYALFLYLLTLGYRSIVTGLRSYHTTSDYRVKELKTSGCFAALYKKEWKRFVTSLPYVVNVGVGVIMAGIVTIAATVMGPEKIGSVMQIPGFLTYYKGMFPLVIATMLGMTCTTGSSISLEGKNVWIIQSAPVSVKTIFHSKIAVNLTLLIPASLFCGICMWFGSGYSVLDGILEILLLGSMSLFTAVWGLMLNMKFPSFDWISDTQVVKQSISSVAGLFGGMIAGVAGCIIVIVGSSVPYRVWWSLFILVFLICAGLMYRRLLRYKRI